MKPTRILWALILGSFGTAAQAAPLPSWNDGPAKEAILKFVGAATDASGPDFVPPEERIATFDQDGTLWVEQPIYAQIAISPLRFSSGSPPPPIRDGTDRTRS